MRIPEEIAVRRSEAYVARSFERLIGEGKIHGAELNPYIIKKSGGRSPFLAAPRPSLRKLLSRWEEVFQNRIAPDEFLEEVSGRIDEYGHEDNFLLFGSDRIIYDTQILHSGAPVGGMTLYFRAVRDDRLGLRAYLAGRRLRFVYIEQIRLRERSSGYASALFRRYEALFRGLGFHQFRLNASLSVGKYYWAKEGFDCSDPSDIAHMKDRLRALVRERELPVTETEINRLNHAYDFAMFRRDLKVPAFRGEDGYYSLVRREGQAEESQFPVGKALLLCGTPWDGHKVIYTDTPRRTGFVFSEAHSSHKVRSGHRENGKRLAWLMKRIYREELHQSLVFLEPYVPGMEHIHRVHSSGYVESFRRAAEGGAGTFMTRDCSVSVGSYRAALLAAGAVMAGVDAVMHGRVENVFCAVRPPGHHAGEDAAMGFCFLNNIAVGASYARAVYGVKRVFILDWDVHHGNGTQAIFECDPAVFFCSIHEHPSFCFPGTGRRTETGRESGEGYTLNLPLQPGAGDRELAERFDGEIVPAVERFRPELILVSAGFDGHAGDSIAELELTESSFVHMTLRLCELADKHCRGRVVSVLEGGYDRSSLPASAVAHLRALQGRS